MKMMNEFHLDIAPDGVIQILKQEVLLKDNGEKVVLNNWRTTVPPGDFQQVEQLPLADYHLNIIQAAWTNEVVELYHLKQQEKEEEEATEESGLL